MKIAVLFGSFNPLTNAHIAALRNACEHLEADKGLFVATNGKYLKRKAVKINDAFLLSEDERKDIIENVCASEQGLEFWGFELGGAVPKRYKTLAKIQKQYPDAKLFEVQGADKVLSVSRFGDREEYVNNIEFAVFGRNGINLNDLFEADPFLSQYKTRFTLLPPLNMCAEVSSTQVRRRFYEGKDYSELIPKAAVDVLSKYTPSNFSISFEDRMQALISGGRFGVNAAQKEVYSENNKLFSAWRKGEPSLDFGNYTMFLDNTRLFKAPFDVTHKGVAFPATQTGCANIDCVDLAKLLLDKGYNPAILNLASAKRPCGAYDLGLSAQEESLCRSSNLSLSLYQYGDPKYKNVRTSGVVNKEIGYPLNLNYGGIYTPNVTFFRRGKSCLYSLRENPFKCDVITVAALSFSGRTDFSYADEMSFCNENGGFTPEGEEIMLNKIRTIFRLGVLNGKVALVLGAFGCGAYKLPVNDVALLFKRVLNEPEFKNKFKLITFAILESEKRPNGFNGKFAPYYNLFGSFPLN